MDLEQEKKKIKEAERLARVRTKIFNLKKEGDNLINQITRLENNKITKLQRS